MTRCILKALVGLWSFILGSLRIILFFGCILYVLFMSLISMATLFRYANPNSENMLGSNGSSFLSVLFVLFYLGVGILGCHASFFKHHKNLRLFSLIMATSAIVFVVMSIHDYRTGEYQEVRNAWITDLKREMKDYDWYHSSESKASINATENWDVLQSMFLCCGIKGPEDWVKYRPIMSFRTLPSSCCAKNRLSREGSIGSDGIIKMEPCSYDDRIYATGCEERFDQVVIVFAAFIVGLLIYKVLLAALAFMVANCNINPQKIPVVVTNNVAGDNRNLINPNYKDNEIA